MSRLALLLLLLSAAPACLAQSAVHHCVSAHGTPVFTDQPCDSVQSQRVGARPARTGHACPATREALRQRVADAFARHDANALAGLMLWQGYADIDAVREVARLKRLMRRPLLDVADTDLADTSTTGSTSPPAVSGPSVPQPRVTGELWVRLSGVPDGDDSPLRFTVEARAGCLWLRP